MNRYLLIESRDPFESGDTRFVAGLARDLQTSGNAVTVFLVQNGVLAARKLARESPLTHLIEGGVTVLADDFSLRERGIASGDLAAGVRESGIDTIVDMLIDQNAKALWH
jgi:predicted peroxiredoxin